MFDPMTLQPVTDVDPPPFHLLNEAGGARALLICDHASNALPRGYGSLGIDPDKMFEHIAWDVGAAAVTRTLSDLLDAPGIMGGVSRLFTDLRTYNRALHPYRGRLRSGQPAAPARRCHRAAGFR